MNKVKRKLNVAEVFALVMIFAFPLLMVLKLTSVIDWSWWWVCSPLIILLAFVIVCLIIGTIYAYVQVQKNNRKYNH